MKLFRVQMVYVEGDGRMAVDFEDHYSLAVHAGSQEEAKSLAEKSVSGWTQVEGVSEVDASLPAGQLLQAFGIKVV